MDEVMMRRRYLVMDGKCVGSNIRLLRWSYCLVVNEILNLVTKVVVTISFVTALLMACIIFGGVMSSREWVRKRLGIKRFEKPSFHQDF